jgi:hypothetical protein
MKTVYVNRDYLYRPHPKRAVLFKGSVTYRRVIEHAASAIERAGAGRIVLNLSEDAPGHPTKDARHAFRRRR